MAGSLDRSEAGGTPESMQASADAFSQQLTLRVEALVREVVAGHEVQLRRLIMEESDKVSMLRCENATLRRELDIAKAAGLNVNSSASARPAVDEARIKEEFPLVRIDVDEAAPRQVDGQEFLDAPRLQQVEDVSETPQVPLQVAEQPSSWENPLPAQGGRTGRASSSNASSSGRSDLPSKVTTVSQVSVARAPDENEREKMKAIVHAKFKQLDRRKTGQLNAENLRSCVHNHNDESEMEMDGRIEKAIEAFNMANTRFQPTSQNLCALTFEGFFHIMISDNFNDNLSTEEEAVLTEVKEICVNEAAMKLIASKAMVKTTDMTAENKNRFLCLRLLEPLSGFIICVNALCIGIQLDVYHEWKGWQIIEVLFTFFFIFELALKLHLSGFIETYFGDDLRWNVFDTLIVTLATVDLCFWLGNQLGSVEMVNLRQFSILRLSRLMRITRIVRLLKLNFFKDLTIMINGVFGGLKTLFWAFVLLLIIIYIVGVVLRQVIVTADSDCASSNATSTCSPAEEHLLKFERQLFSTLFRSMFTVFRCLIDGCSSADGTPLVLYFYDTHGILFIVGYVLIIVFILFGVFNLIMAIFVEKTLEYAKLDTAKRREARYREEVRIAKEFQSLVLKICANRHCVDRKKSGRRNMENLVSGFRFTSRRAGIDDMNRDGQQSTDSASQSLQMTISRENFDSIINQEDIRKSLEDLEISTMSSAKLFDILDSNGSGSVDVAELAEGLMSLRGAVDKGDIISSSLMVKSTQKMVKDMQDELTLCIQNQNRQIALLHQLETNLKFSVAPSATV